MKTIVAKYASLMSEAEEFIYRHPEFGFRETITDNYMKTAFASLGYHPEPYEGIPGFSALFDTGREGPTLLLVAEIDEFFLKKATDAVFSALAHASRPLNTFEIIRVVESLYKEREDRTRTLDTRYTVTYDILYDLLRHHSIKIIKTPGAGAKEGIPIGITTTGFAFQLCK